MNTHKQNKKMSITARLLNLSLVLALVTLAAGCVPAPAAPTAAPSLAPTPAPTVTNVPTSIPTVAPSNTPAPRPTDTPPAVSPTPGKITLTWMMRESFAEINWAKQVASEFEDKNPGITIKVSHIDYWDYDLTLHQYANLGQPADIFSQFGFTGFRDYLDHGMVADLTSYIQKDNFDLTDFDPAALELYKTGDKVWALPFTRSGIYIFYNKDIFDQAGVKYPPTNWDDKTWTWQALREDCKAIDNLKSTGVIDSCLTSQSTINTEDITLLWGQDIYPDSVYQTGLIDETYLSNPQVSTALANFLDMTFKDHYFPTIDEYSNEYESFLKERVPMSLDQNVIWPISQEFTRFTWGVAALPYGAENRQDQIYTLPWMMSSQSRHPHEAWAFLKYLASPEVQASHMKLGVPPVRKSLIEQWYAQFPGMKPEELKEVYLGSLKYGREAPHHLLVGSSQINEEIAMLYINMWLETGEPNELLTATDEKVKQILSELKMAK